MTKNKKYNRIKNSILSNTSHFENGNNTQRSVVTTLNEIEIFI